MIREFRPKNNIRAVKVTGVHAVADLRKLLEPFHIKVWVADNGKSKAIFLDDPVSGRFWKENPYFIPCEVDGAATVSGWWVRVDSDGTVHLVRDILEKGVPFFDVKDIVEVIDGKERPLV